MSGWSKFRLKHLTSVPITNGLGERGEFDDPSWPRYIRTTDIAGPDSLRSDTFKSLPPEVAARAMLRSGDILMTAAGATIGKSFTFREEAPACYAGYLVRFRPDLRVVDGRFIAYWMQSSPYWAQVEAQRVKSTIENFSASRYQNLELEVPEKQVQGLIANFLDVEIRRIDDLVAENQRLIELVADRFHAWRELQLVANSEVRLIPLMHLTDPRRPIVYGIVQAGGEWPGGVPYIKTGDMKSFDIATLSQTDPEIEEAYRRARVHPGDIVIAMRASIGALLIVPVDLPVANLTQGTARIAARRGVNASWLFQALQTSAVQDQFDVRAVGTTFRTLNIWDLRRVMIPVPPWERHDYLAVLVHNRELRVNAGVTQLRRRVDLLTERRNALITAAVTGQLEIPGVAA